MPDEADDKIDEREYRAIRMWAILLILAMIGTLVYNAVSGDYQDRSWRTTNLCDTGPC